jgi:hypothetical protein
MILLPPPFSAGIIGVHHHILLVFSL